MNQDTGAKMFPPEIKGYAVGTPDGEIEISGVSFTIDQDGALWINGENQTVVAVFAKGQWLSVRTIVKDPLDPINLVEDGEIGNVFNPVPEHKLGPREDETRQANVTNIHNETLMDDGADEEG